MKSMVVIDGVRTPFCRAGSSLASLSAADLGHHVVTALLARTGLDPEIVDHTIFGCVCQPAETANIARVIALRSGVPESVPAVTVQRNCASGLEAVTSACEKAAAGGEVFIVGGTESMSNVPLLFPQSASAKFLRLSKAKSFLQKLKAFAGFRPSDFKPISALLLGLTDSFVNMNMGETAELLARDFGISGKDQDRFAMESHLRAAAAKERLAEEIAPVFTTKGTVDADNGVRPDSSEEALAKLRPAFDKANGSVTPGNSSQISDGAVALLLMTEDRAAQLGLKPLGRILNWAWTGCDPKRMGLGPAGAITAAGVDPAEADIVEINEAFAVQVLAVLEKLGNKIPRDRLNVNGGAIALGHPVGASGARLVLTALKELNRRGARRALVSLCIGGGQGGALWLERI
ncbi:MAG TPA: thiolase family protein [Verrucomicrobiales bacterium]|jgi:acetyl-CoA C-acetyltransferase/acetyl-CoA acyltransferase|nr:thiolase family protein [Verrucomicrobiales bacterium]